MNKLLKFELHNLFRQIIVYIILVIMLGFLLLNNYPSRYLLEYGYDMENMMVEILTNGYFTYFLAAIIPFIVCRDYEQNVIKNIYAKGYTKEKVYTAKFIFSIIVTAGLFLIAIAVGTIEAVGVFGWNKTHVFDILTAQLFAMLAYAAFYNLFSQIFKKSGISIAFLLFVPPLGGLLLDTLDYSLNLPISFGDFWITQTMAYLHSGTIDTKEIVLSIITSVVYIVGCYFIGKAVIKKQYK
ncbi:MAG: hypothetical protein MJ113_01155 [Lachnospiraceae bacterium]|nr:hypothetical protein [Lachnospiraceae bacterium]